MIAMPNGTIPKTAFASDFPIEARAYGPRQRRYGDDEFSKHAEEHADIIRRFGRFPHRNAALGCTAMPEEQAFLDNGGFAG